MLNMAIAKYLWIDLETTGLIARQPGPDGRVIDCILECAAIVTTAELETLEVFSAVLGYPAEVLAVMNEWCRTTHTESGLLAEVDKVNNAFDYGRNDLDRDLCNLVARHEWAPEDDKPGKPILAGSSPHFDREFLHTWCPGIDKALHYRHFDVSAIKMMIVDATGSAFEKGSEAHRALADIESSLAFARSLYQHTSTVTRLLHAINLANGS